MSDFKSRLLEERSELSEKIEKLKDFLNSSKTKQVEDVQLALLEVQVYSMDTYLECLDKRIERL